MAVLLITADCSWRRRQHPRRRCRRWARTASGCWLGGWKIAFAQNREKKRTAALNEVLSFSGVHAFAYCFTLLPGLLLQIVETHNRSHELCHTRQIFPNIKVQSPEHGISKLSACRLWGADRQTIFQQTCGTAR